MLLLSSNESSCLKSRFVDAFLSLLRQGVTPQKLALTVALGIGLGTFPILGATTLLCTAVAIMLRLNLPAIQTTNYCAYPLQLALIFPFARLGAKLLRATPVAFTPAQLPAVLHQEMFGTLRALAHATVHAVIGWAVVAPLATALIYFALLPLLTAIASRYKPAAAAARAASAGSS
jgi:uncharacterized protein (DUF2062 family)